MGNSCIPVKNSKNNEPKDPIIIIVNKTVKISKEPIPDET